MEIGIDRSAGRVQPHETRDGFFVQHGVWAPGVRPSRRRRFTAKAVIVSATFPIPMLALAAWQRKARAPVTDAIRPPRYGGGESFRIHDLRPRMVMQPTRPEPDGEDLAGIRDPNGVALSNAFDDEVSRVARFQPWGRIFGCGVRVVETRRHMEAITQGDLPTSASPRGRDEAAQPMPEMRRLQDSLRRMVLKLKASRSEIVPSRREIAAASGDLCPRTEPAAANLQPSAASMARIADIIGTIDSIAFQTNILALNAAVEAARAGEQGRGFAVVAGEVRSLAQRSASAAREIKSLIGGSVRQVESGEAVVRRAGDTMQEIVAASGQVNQLLTQIDAGSREQSAGIGQIGQGIQELDRMTQQNAAMVEQTAAAADSMNSQARSLAAIVAEFQLPAGSDASR